eukprot:CAMPEP_0114285700 /NCGR_PEP_ID=MMETSP0059-20121206/5344_1 /TAXON_ID=36894 /ORGANISM="Pyramimonas parkeae, Strain CCMP726" /LENGTH=35 /DNA_ID= /DNA_START= /DNA_END= /DNA_ORIENTATION=
MKTDKIGNQVHVSHKYTGSHEYAKKPEIAWLGLKR